MEIVTLHKDIAPFLARYHIQDVELHISPVGLVLSARMEQNHAVHKGVFDHMARSIQRISSFAVTKWPLHIVIEALPAVAKGLAKLVRDKELWAQGWVLHVVPPGEGKGRVEAILVAPVGMPGVVDRLDRLEIEDFRCWKSRNGTPRKFELGADMVLITGATGTGKSALIDAICAAANGGKGVSVSTESGGPALKEYPKPEREALELETNAILSLVAPSLGWVTLDEEGAIVPPLHFSTGQKYLIGFATAVARARLTRHLVAVPALFFDGLVEALDQMSLLLVLAVIRQLAYHPDPQQRHQVFLTSRQDEVTSQVAERLRPPDGCKLRVFDIFVGDGRPEYQAYVQQPEETVYSMSPSARMASSLARMWTAPLVALTNGVA